MSAINDFVWFKNHQIAVNLYSVDIFNLSEDEHGPTLTFHISDSNEPVVISDKEDIDNFLKNAGIEIKKEL